MLPAGYKSALDTLMVLPNVPGTNVLVAAPLISISTIGVHYLPKSLSGLRALFCEGLPKLASLILS